ncbi:DUF6443 domain-containing protein [Bacteroides sp.]
MKTQHLKYIFLLCLYLISFSVSWGQSGEYNYIRTRVMKNETNNPYTDVVQYYDGLGRLIQTVQVGVTPGKEDLVTLQEYDSSGRESNLWLPGKGNGNGAFTAIEALKNNSTVLNAYPEPYSYPVYDGLNRVVRQYAPGQDRHQNAGGIVRAYQTDYLFDTCTNRYEVQGEGSNTTLVNRPDAAHTGYSVTRETDEEGNILSYTYIGRQNQAIFVRQPQSYASGTSGTNYVYDDYGKLCFVLSPKASNTLSNTYNQSWNEKNCSALDESGYIYRYDHRDRCVAKKLPGCDWIYYVYDKTDRLIFTQDGEQRTRGEWTFTLSDRLGRETLTGICKNTDISVDSYKEKVVRATRTGDYWGYSILGFIPVDYTILSANFYDDYSFTSLEEFHDLNYQENPIGYTQRFTGSTGNESKGLLTGTLLAVLPISAGEKIATVNYYDYRGRLVQQQCRNHLGWTDTYQTKYDFEGKVLEKLAYHTSIPALKEKVNYSYDHVGRLLTATHQVNDGDVVTLSSNTYDDLGRLTETIYGDNEKQKTVYTYNLQSNLTAIDNDFFKERLTYRYNGNVLKQELPLSADNMSYTYSYDNLSRLTHAAYSGTSGNYETHYSYDLNSNITSIQRYGKTTSSTFGLIDDLTLSYFGQGNQCQSVGDDAEYITSRSSLDFKDYVSSPVEYSYNKNGAMTMDLNKGVSSIRYNSLNLPYQIDIKSPVAEARVGYLYNAAGTRLQVKRQWNPNYATTPIIGSVVNPSLMTEYDQTDYVDNIECNKDKYAPYSRPSKLYTDNGYYQINDKKYYFYYTDHQGSNRCIRANSTRGKGTMIDYYPFGSPIMESLSSSSLYSYTGKEINTSLFGLNLYDFIARYYDSVIGRFMTIDPLCEKHYDTSPYVFCGNNPVNAVDPDGRNWYRDNYGDLRWQEGSHAIEGYTDIGSTVSIQMGGEGGYLNYYQNAIISISNAPKDAFETIKEHPEVQNELLSGESGVLSEESKSELFNGLNGRSVDNIARPIGEALVEYGAAELGGLALGKVVAWGAKGVSRLLGKAAVETGASAVETGTYTVYRGYDGAQKVRYVGITGREPTIRFAEHKHSGTARAALNYRKVSGANNLTKEEARILEQTFINQYGLGKNGGQLLNRINSISPKYWQQYGVK